MNKVIFADFIEYDDKIKKLGNHHYCNCFIKDGFEVLWVSNSFNELIYFKDKKDYFHKKSISKAERHSLAPNVYGFSAYSSRLYGNYPFSKNPKIVLNNEKYIKPDAKDTLEKIDFYQVDVLWISNPKLYWLTNVVNYKKLVYRIPDDFSQFKEYPNIELIEEKLIQKADLVFITARNLAPKVERYNKTAYLLSNGVEFEHFSSLQSTNPFDPTTKNRKKIIYVGTIKYWFDIQLVHQMALEIDADIYIIGKPEFDLSIIASLPNVHILGPRPYSEIPSYLAYADVAIIPFIKSELSDAVSPIKLYEYCSAGIAVVCSSMEEVRNSGAPIYVAKDNDDFIRGVNQYIRDGYNRNELMEFGQKNSWAARYQFVKNLLDM